MGDGLQKVSVDFKNKVIIATTNWSWYSEVEVIKDKNFLRIFFMLFCSMQFCYFVKLHFVIYGS